MIKIEGPRKCTRILNQRQKAVVEWKDEKKNKIKIHEKRYKTARIDD